MNKAISPMNYYVNAVTDTMGVRTFPTIIVENFLLL